VQPHRSAFTAQALAHTLAHAARRNAVDPEFRSPWILEAAAAGALPLWRRLRPRGGKLDDCTAVVVFAEREVSQGRSGPASAPLAVAA
jgi:hypothetical protein